MPTRADAQAYAKAIEEIGQQFGENVKMMLSLRYEQQRLNTADLSRLETLIKMPPETRRMFLSSPGGQQSVIRMLHPEAFDLKGQIKKGYSYSGFAGELNAMGQPTSLERAAQTEAEQKALKATSEANMAKYQEGLKTGLKTPSMTDLITNFDFKDPYAAALSARAMSDPTMKEYVSQLALAEKKGGPEYTKQQMPIWFEKYLNMGLPPAVSMQYASATVNGQWDKIPLTYTDMKSGKQIPVRTNAEQAALNETLNAASRMQEVQNTISNSITQSQQWLMKEAGLTQEDALKNVMAMRAGKPAPVPTPHLQAMAAFDQMVKAQEIEKNTQTILNDQAGIGAIRETLGTLLNTYKEAGSTYFTGAMTSAQKTDLEDKINQTVEALNARLAGRYGIQYKGYDQLHPWGAAVSGALKQAMVAGQIPDMIRQDLGVDAVMAIKAAVEKVDQRYKDAAIGGQVQGTGMPEMTGKGTNLMPYIEKKRQHTPEQKRILQSMADQFNTALQDPSTPSEQKNQMLDFIKNRYMPAYQDPDKFMNLFNIPTAGAPTLQPPAEQ